NRHVAQAAVNEAAQAAVRLPSRPETRLVGRFLVATVVGLAVAGVAIFAVVERALVGQAQREAIERARLASSALLDHRLRPSDLGGPIRAGRRRQLVRLLGSVDLGADVRGVTLYGSTEVVASTAPGGLRTPTAALVQKGRAGVVVSAVESTGGGKVLRT